MDANKSLFLIKMSCFLTHEKTKQYKMSKAEFKN